MKVTLKWLGKEATAIRTEKNGEKVAIKPGKTLVVEYELAKSYQRFDKRFQIIKEPTVAKAPPAGNKDAGKKPGQNRKTAPKQEDPADPTPPETPTEPTEPANGEAGEEPTETKE